MISTRSFTQRLSWEALVAVKDVCAALTSMWGAFGVDGAGASVCCSWGWGVLGAACCGVGAAATAVCD